MLKIHYDGLIYMLQAAGGVNKYFANIICRLPQDVVPILTTYQIRDQNLPHHPRLQRMNYHRFKPGIACSALRPYFFRTINLINKYGVAHPTYYSLLTGQGLERYRCPVVITLYDFILEKFSNKLDPTGANSAAKRNAILAADKIICISENTKKDLLETYPVSEHNIVVTHLASDLELSMAGGDEACPGRPYFLYVGGRSGYKNFAALLKSFAFVAGKRPDPVLYVVGAAFDAAENSAIAALGLVQRVEHYGYATDSQLAKLYRHCVAFVYPSLYEGFGIPPLEAMSCGAPVIACNVSSVPEVVGDAGLLFAPGSSDDLTEMLFTLLENGSERDRLITLGKERAKMFSWDKTAAQTVEVYRSLT